MTAHYQPSFDRYLPKHQRKRATYGGRHVKGRRKVMRPVDPSKPLHVVMKSSLAKGGRSFLHSGNKRFIANAVEASAKNQGVTVLEWKNVGNHLHFLLRFKDRKAPGRFLRVLGARISMRLLGLKKSASKEELLGKGKKFWDDTPFSRIVYEWLKPGEGLMRYLRKNHYEGLGWDEKAARLLAAQLPPDVDFGPPIGRVIPSES